MHMLFHALFGLVVGIAAKLLLPGHQPGGLILTCFIGVAGGWVGGQLGSILDWYPEGHPAGFGLSVVGAMALLLLYRVVVLA